MRPVAEGMLCIRAGMSPGGGMPESRLAAKDWEASHPDLVVEEWGLSGASGCRRP